MRSETREGEIGSIKACAEAEVKIVEDAINRADARPREIEQKTAKLYEKSQVALSGLKEARR